MLEELLDGTRVVVLLGAGGVGKTTSASALAMAAAHQGQRVVVLTVDPADANFALGECPSGSEERAATRPASREGLAPCCASPDRLHHT